MRVSKFIQLVATIVIPVALLTGCNLLTNTDQTVQDSNNDWEQTTDLVSEFGGYEFTNEADSFSDPAMKALELEQPVVAVADSDTTVTANSFAVRILWGQLEGNREALEALNWEGSLSVSSGRLTVLRTIAFEHRTDHLLRRDSRQIVNFTSMTKPHFDGLLLLIHNPNADLTATLSMNTGPYTGSWTFEQLMSQETVVRVDDLGNAVSASGIDLPDDTACPGGVARGHWLQRDGERGVFRGLWVTRLGRPIGQIRGHFGVNSEGQKVWFAKIIARGGDLIGLARGTYEDGVDASQPGGTFQGEWAAGRGDRTGVIKGRFVPGRIGDQAATGFFQARWQSNCAIDGDGSGDPGNAR